MLRGQHNKVAYTQCHDSEGKKKKKKILISHDSKSLDMTWNIYFYYIKHLSYSEPWVPVSLTGKMSYSCIRDLGFNPRLHQKLIEVNQI